MAGIESMNGIGKSVPSVNICKYLVCLSRGVDRPDVLFYPGDDMVLECAFDKLV